MTQGRPLQSYIATTALGLERVLGAELEELGARDVHTWGGGARFQGDRRMMIRACLWLRTAHRVRWILGHGTARSADDLYRSIQKMARWKALVPASHTLRVDATARNSCFNDARFAALRTKDAIVDAVRDATGDRPSINLEEPDVSVHVRIVGDQLTVGLEASGGSLHARGYRTESGPAPLRETLAAGLLRLADWDKSEPLFDPMCGSGTLLIEAAWLSENRPPNLDRRFGFERWPGFRLDRLATIRHAAAEEIRVSDATIAGSDRDRKIISAARANAERAGCGDRITLEGEIGLDPGDRPGLLVANPPYGERMGDDREALRTYEALGKLLSTTFIGWRGAVLAKSEEQLRAMGLPITKRFPLKNGPLDILLGLVGPEGR